MTGRLTAEEALAFPLSFGQQRLWLLDRLLADRAAYNVPTFLAVRGPLRVAALAAAFAAVVERHEVLRTTFAELGGEPVQVVGEPFVPSLPVVDLAALPLARRDREAALLAAREAGRPFELTTGPLLRLALLRLGDEEHHLLLNLHHIVCDEWSMGVLVREVGALYLGRELPELPLQYADFAVWQREEAGEGIAADLAFWRRELAEASTVLDLPLDRPRSVAPSLVADAVPFGVEPGVFARLKAWMADAQGSSFMLLAAGFGTLLGRYSGQSDLLLGAPAAYRHRSELEGLVGFFLNTLVLRLVPHPARAWEDYFAAVRATTLAAFAHQEIPFEQLVAEVVDSRARSETALPLVQILLSFEGASVAPPELPGLELAPLALPGVSAKFELNLNAGEHGGGLAGALTFWTDLFDRPTVARMAGQLAALLVGVAADPRQRLGELPLLAAAERHQVLAEWNDTVEPFADAAPLHELFLRQAAERPDGVAVVFGEEQLSYGEIEEQSGRLAGWLAARGVEAESRVGVALERSAELPGVLLGVLRAGGAYVPLDPGQPVERLAELVADAAPALVLREKDLNDIKDSKDCKDLGSASLENLAAVIYTSGSTGRPKGVMVPHAGLVNRLLWSRRTYPVRPGDRVLQKGSLVFDISVWEIFGPLVAGATSVLLPPGDHLHADRVAAALERHAITMVHSVPSMLGALAAEPAFRRHRSLRWLFSGGEALPLALRDRLLEVLPGRMHNQYGPTEASIDVSFGAVGAPDPSFRSASLGRPMANTRLHVVDEAGGLVPPGGLGELWIGGANLTRGYWRRPGRTAASFVPDPFGSVPGGRLYRTGDRVRQLADGRLEHAGRLDGQVKVRGVRIELGEIEVALAALPGVREAAVAVREGAAGPQIVGYVVPANPGATLAGDGLRQALRRRLPEALVPAVFVELATLPRTPSGKLDRKALPAPDRADTGGSPPVGPIEEALARIWAEVLKRPPQTPQIGAEESFFALGGHSLLAAQVVTRVRERLGQEIPLAQLFERPTIRGLSAWIEERVGAAPASPFPRPPGLTAFPLSFGQERLWLLDRLLADRSVYNVPAALEARGPLDAGALAAAFAAVVARHEILRTTFAVQDGRGVQVVDAGPAPLLRLADLSRLPGDLAAREAGRLGAEDVLRPFDLERGPVARATLVRLSAVLHHLLLTFHHIASDEWSLALLVDEIAALYRAATGGPPARLPALPAQYADFALWQRGAADEIEEQLGYWHEELAGAPTALELPVDRPWPAVASFRAEAVALEFPPNLSARLDAQAAGARATLFMLLLAGYGTLLARVTGQHDLLVGTPVARRHRREVEGVAGFFLNTLPLRLRLDPETAWSELVEQVRETTVAAFAHQDVAFERLVAELAPGRDLAASPLVQNLFVFTSTPAELPDLPGLTLEPLAPPGASAKFELTLHLGMAGGKIGGAFTFWTDLFDRPTVERLAGHFERLLAGAAEDPARPVGDLDGLSKAERHQLLREWNDSEDPETAAACLDELVERRVQAAPEAVAAVFEGEHLSYGGLWERSLEAAERLSAHGVGFETRVGLAFERSLEALVGLLGVLGAGGVAVFLDPRQPEERRAGLVAEAGVEVVLGDGEGHQGQGHKGQQGPRGPKGPRPPEGLAAILFTSGSTGRPKGVMLSHRGLAHRLLGSRGTCALVPGDRVLHKAPTIFDIALWETLAPLVAGGTVVVARPGGHTDTAYLAELVLRERVTLAHFIPSILKLFLEEPGLGEMGDLRAVFSGGEALPFGLRDRAGDLLSADLYNQYGPTEASIDVSSGPALGGAGSDRGAFRAVPIGRPLGSTRLFVADASLRLVPPGALGELVIGGAHLARGYGGDAARTAERFVPDPFAAEPGGRLYRSGDRVRHLADGRIEYAGRIDRQVKVRGVRIEPGEIEAALAALPGVREAAVVVRVAPNGEVLLAAYVSPPEPGGVAPAELREALRRRLPEAMVPAAWMGLPALPRTPSGKLDRNALPSPGALTGKPRPPEGPIEAALARLWEELLHVEGVGGEDNFFILGGHSLLAIRLAFQIREAFGAELPPAAVFEEPVLAALAGRIEAALARSRELTPEERREILAAGQAQRPPMGIRSLAEIFVERAAAQPEAPALTFQGKHLSYGELEERSRRLARHLLALGVEPDTPVALFCERTPELVVALLAVLRAGSAYVPLDPLLPEERLRYLLDDCGASLVLRGPGTPDLLVGDGITVLDLADLEPTLSDSGPELPVHLDPTLAAYWIYTSGSTGNPKPVAVPHAQVARLLSSSDELFGFGPDDVWTLFHSYAFDFSVWEIWGALAYGGRLVIVPYLDSRSPADFARLLDEQQVTVLNQTPSAFYQLAAHARQAGGGVGTSLSWVIFGGEPLEAGRLEGWLESRPGRPRLVNMYGITETTVHVTFGEVQTGEPRGAGTSIGRPLSDLALYVLDAALEPCPRQVTGELVVGGAGLARGYAGRPALTAERFVPDPFGGEPGVRLYRSGDLGRLLPDGRFEHWGRADRQVKIRGFRIEPGEIEAALVAHPGVSQAAVTVRGERLVSYVVPREGAGAGGQGLDTLRAFLAARLPSHMVPAAFVSLARLPLTPNGKLDVRRLPEPAGERPDLGAAYEPPRTTAEKALAVIWSELLRIDRISLHDDFFTLGGHSLLALRVDWQIREVFGVELPLTVLFERSTLAELAGRIERALEEEPATSETPFPRLDRADGGPVEAPLSFAQQRLWFLHQLEPGDASYNMPFALRIEGPLDRRALATALAEIVRRHEVLRTVYVAAAGEPRQRVLPAPADSAPPPDLLPLVDLAGLPALRRVSESTAVLGEIASRPFDLGARPPLRAALVSLTGEDHLAALTLHHIAGDAWSLDVLARELAALYAAFREGRPSPLPDLPVQYGDFALWQCTRLAGETLARHLFFWRGQLAGAPAAHSLPFDRPRRAERPGGHGPADGRSLVLGEEAAARVREAGREHAATPFMVLLALWQALLAQLGGETDVVVGTPVARRPRPELEGLIGFFVNNLALRADLAAPGEDVLSFDTHLARVRKATLGAFAHQDLPFERLVEELAPRRDRHRQPIFQISFTLGGPPVLAPELPGLRVTPQGAEGGLAKFDLSLSTTLDEAGLALSLAFDADLFDSTTIDRHLRHFARLLEAALAAPERPLAEIDLLSEAERQQIETRPRLPPPGPSVLTGATAPESATEQVLAEIWRDVLGVAQVAREDSFFALGGHSLLATRLLFRLRERFRVELPLGDVFDHPTLAELAARIEALDGAVDTPATPPADPIDPVDSIDGSFTVVALSRKRHRIQAKDLDPRR